MASSQPCPPLATKSLSVSKLAYLRRSLTCSRRFFWVVTSLDDEDPTIVAAVLDDEAMMRHGADAELDGWMMVISGGERTNG